MTCKTRCNAALLALLLALPVASPATTVAEMAIDALARQAELIFEGEVVAVESLQGTDGRIGTFVTFAVIDVIKGDATLDSLELKFLGGSAGGRTVAVSGMRIPELGERGIYFVESTGEDLVNPLLGWSQGHFLLTEDASGAARVFTGDNRAVIDVQPQDSIPPLIRRSLGLVDGETESAAGVIVSETVSETSPGLTPDQFKQRIRQLLE